jgi:medium-chain acyl-[acyl-carrier-protein] hydrolase
MTTSSRWLACVHANASARLRLFCFAHAGGSANYFAQWWHKLPADVEVCPVELPGRWSRWREEPLRDISTVSRSLVRNLAPELAEKPFAFYGHSLGGLVAYETILRLREIGRELPRGLIVSGRRPPDAPLYADRLHGLADEPFIKGVGARYEPIDPRVLADPDTKAMVLRVLRADLEMLETYRATAATALDLPIWVFAAHDDTVAPPEAMQGWSDVSTREVKGGSFDGGHFFTRDSEPFLQALSEVIRTL